MLNAGRIGRFAAATRPPFDPPMERGESEYKPGRMAGLSLSWPRTGVWHDPGSGHSRLCPYESGAHCRAALPSNTNPPCPPTEVGGKFLAPGLPGFSFVMANRNRRVMLPVTASSSYAPRKSYPALQEICTSAKALPVGQ